MTIMPFLHQLDVSALLFIQEHLRLGFLTPLMIFFSSAGSAGLLWIAAGGLMLAFKKTRYCGVAVLLCLLISWTLNDVILKPIIHRLRPYRSIPELRALLPLRQDFSFPSGHTATAFASAFAVTYILGRRWFWVYAVAALIAFSRMYLGMHYPTDILGGIAVGTLSAWVLCKAADKYLKPQLIQEKQYKKYR